MVARDGRPSRRRPDPALDALVALSDAGLVHRWGHYVIPTRAAMHCYWLFG